MKQIDPKESDALLVYHRYWNSYSDGDLEVFASTLDEGFEMIGTSESEICHSKDDGIAFFKSQMHEIVGRTEMRNRNIIAKEVNGMFLINEICDVYIFGEPEWTFYSRLRLSTLLHETESGWKVIQQHGSLPDMRVQEGETIAFDKISKENLELRDAVRRRTAELENKNRELAIEAALEKVRAVAMGMKNPNAMLDVCRVIAEQLEEFGVTKIRNVQTAIIDEHIGQYLCYQYFPAYGQTTIEDTEYHKSPVEHEMVRQMLASRDGHFTGSLSGKELEEFGLHRKEENHFPDPLLDAASEVSYCFLSIGEGGLGLSLYKEMEAGVLELFKRFHQVFSLAYQRFRDIQKAEAQTREAQIEVAVERVRAQSMAMHHPDELDKVNKEILSQLNWLQIEGLTGVTFYLLDEKGWVKAWDFSNPGNLANQSSYTLEFDSNKHEMLGFPFKTLIQTDLDYFVADYPLEKLEKAVFEIEEINPEVATVIKEALAKGILTHQWTACARITDGLLGIDLVNPPSEDTKTIVLKIAGAFNQAYQRFLDLQKAEAQAREAQIEAALERVRAQTMAMHSSEDVGKSVVKMFSELTALGVDEGTRFGIGILNHDNENNQLWTARKNGEEVNMHIGNLDMSWHPLLISARKAWMAQIPFHKYVLEGEDLLDYYRILNTAPDYKIQIPLEQLPEREIQHCFIFEHGFFYAFNTREFKPELIQITKRFSSLFEQTYRRFLDLVRAEAQAREAEIELALERVRARTMAMHHTEELKEVIQVVFDQFVGLNIHVDHAGFILDYKEREDMHIWLADHQQGVPTEITIPYFDSPHWNSYREAKTKEESFFANLLPFEVKNKFYRDLFEWIPELTEEAQQAIFNKPALAISTVLLDNVGLYIEHYSMAPYTAEENAILMRFGKVFQQTYTRFLDLQKAEAQARESQIQLALERVRAKTMAMHKSQELAEVAVVLYQELKILGATQEFFECGYVEVDERNNIQRAWSTRPDGSFLKEPYYLPLTGEPVIDARYEAWKQRIPVCHQPVGGELLKRANEFVIPFMNNQEAAEITSSPAVPDPVHFYCGNFSHGYLNINCGEPLSVEEESLLARFTGVFEMTYQRFLDLQKAEAQVREAQIEAALERVRSRSMAMHKSDELLEAGEILFSEMQKLGIESLTAGFVLMDKEEKNGLNYTPDPSTKKIMSLPVIIPHNETSHMQQVVENWKTCNPFFIIEMDEEETIKHQTFIAERSTNFTLNAEQLISISPARLFLHNFYFKEGYLLIVGGTRLSAEQINIMLRFVKVFQQTYTRFLDLQKAEAQAREAQIEAALERVRAKTMAMHNSEDVSSAIATLFSELDRQSIENVRCGIAIIDINKTMEVWSVTNVEETHPDKSLGKMVKASGTLDMNAHKLWQLMYDAWRNKTGYLYYHLSGKDKQKYIDLINTAPGYLSQPLRELPDMHCQFYFFNEGAIWAYSLQPHTEPQQPVMKRFTSVFSQTYLRYRDLQKAEAQAREAQIEAALERVRSRSMAMHKSEELKEVIQLLFEQFRLLNFKIDSAQFDPNYKENDDLNLWTAAPGQPYSILLNIPYVDSPLFNSIKEAKKRGLSFITQQLSYEDKNQFFRHFFQHIKNIPAERQKLIFDSPGMYRAVVFMENVSLAIQNYSNTPYTEEENEVLKRFGKTFEQVYTRFLDLQKAEAQAKEAQIEAALERVRSRSLAMHHSSELSAVVDTLLREFTSLEFTLTFCIINLIDEQDMSNTVWAANPETGKDPESYYMKFEDYPFHHAMWDAWKAQKKRFVYTIEGKEKKIYDEYLYSETEFRRFPKHVQEANKALDRYVAGFTFFKYSGLQTVSLNPISEDELEILERFGKVFEQAYTRFLDLQKAEAQGREAQIQLALERVRARTMSMQKSQELPEAANLLFQQIQSLGMPAWSAGYCTWKEDLPTEKEGKSAVTLWMSSEGVLQPPFTAPTTEDKLFIQMREGAEKGKDLHVVELGGEELEQHYRYMRELPVVGEILDSIIEAGHPLPSFQIMHQAYFSKGFLLFITYEPVPESHDIFKRFAKVFDQTYTRFLDLQKAEAQAREAQIEVVIEKVRAKALAMHRSEEILGVAVSIRDAMVALDLQGVSAATIYLEQDNGCVRVWDITELLESEKGPYLNLDFEFRLEETDSDLWFHRIWNFKEKFCVVEMDKDDLWSCEAWLRSFDPKNADNFVRFLESGQITHLWLPTVSLERGKMNIDFVQPPPAEMEFILPKMAAVFDLAYKRFLDLQKAEAQARESQIEAALERVRSRAMAMHDSQELKEVALELRKQMGLLGQKDLEVCAIHLYGYGEDSFESWSAMKAPGSEAKIVQSQAHFPKRGIRIIDEMMHHYTIGTKDYVLVNEGEKMAEWFKVLKKHAPELHASILDSLGKKPLKQLKGNWAVADFSGGALVMVTYGEPDEVSRNLLRRSANVFEQAYVRFLDLQKAEAQAREAQIEAAVERVRAEAMAMHSTEDFGKVAQRLLQQVQGLGIKGFTGATIYLVDEDEFITGYDFSAFGGLKDAKNQFFRYDANKFPLNGIYPLKEWKKGTSYFELDFDFEKLQAGAKEFEQIDLSIANSLKEALASGKLTHQWAACGRLKNGFIAFDMITAPNEDVQKITIKMSYAFDQAYIRFLDLQKAEAQAREAKIEAALEKVRSRTMAMQRSEELPEVAGLLFQQVKALGVPQFHCGFNIFEIDDKECTWYPGSADGNILPPCKIPLTEHPIFMNFIESRKRGDELFVYEKEGEYQAGHYRYMLSLPVLGEILQNMLDAGIPFPTFQIDHLANFSHGNLLFITSEHFPEMHDTFKRFAKVFEQTYTRFLDLQKAETQAREAQIEAALERVRSRSMGMQRGADLKGVVKELYDQLRLLGFQFGVASIIIMDADTGDLDWWMEGIEDGYDLPEKYHVPYFDHPGHRQQIYHWKNGSDYAVIEISGSEKKAYDAYYFYQTDFVKAPESSKNLMMSQESVTFSMAYMKYGSLSWSPSKLDENQAVVLQRMAIVFEQTYTRFLDLQKAEAQAREAQIEAALEKIRSRSLAMHNSGELEDVIAVLFEKLKGLGLSFDAASIQMFKNGSKDSVSWVANPDVISKPLLIQHPYDEKYLHKSQLFFELWEARKTSKDVLNMRYSFEEKNKYFEYVIKYNPQLPPEVGKRMREAPSYTHSLAVEKNAILIVDSWVDSQISQEDFLVVKRFAKVFDQTYTRFLDLQKAEAQAREAQVEAALERLRSKTMAMHNSKDVGESVATLFDELSALGVLSSHDRCGIGIMQPHEMMEVWTAEKSTGKTELTIGYLDMRPHALLRNVYQSWLDRKETFHYTLEGEDKQLYAESIVNQPRYKIRKDYFSSLEVIEHTDFFFEEGCLYIFSVQPISNESAAVFSRFVKVFGQTYRRYLDLQKAEKQAREAQIEAALEKVRSRSLAMQSPDELIEVARLLREEMGALGVEELETSSIYIQDESSGLTQCWFTIKNPDNPDKAITDQMTLDLQDTWVGQKMDEFYRSKAKQTSILMQGEERIEWIRYCEEKSDLFGTSNFYGETIPDRIYHLYKFSNGYIGAAAPGEISKESWDLLKRATTVFSFAYTRFRDIQMAQSSARAAMRQASLDRVRADISSMRNAEDLDRITPLIFKELTVLGVPFIRCGVFIIQEKQKIVEAYLSSPEGNSLGVLRLPYQASELTYQTVEAWRKGAVYRQHWNKEDFIQWINQLMELDQIQDSNTYQGSAAPPESLDLHFVPFTQGMIYVGAVYPLDDKDLELVQVLAKAFSIAYARFEDFVKLEQAKAEIESAMSELKATQSQLVQQEKLASLGQLTAGIAHEIKNPLNFVNNFSEVSIEMMEEALEEMEKREDRDETLIREILEDIRSNIKKVHEHGSRANGIVTSMLQHSRGGTGKKEPTDLNALIKEYVNLSFHGMRAGKNPINVDIILDLDPDIKEVSLIKEDFTRVIINLCNNAFDAMRTVTTLHAASLRVRTKKQGDKITIEVEDNGPGIPDDIKDKILQPFFTTKKGTEGTGLGLSITHDIVKAHGGELRVESQEGMGTVFSIHLPKN